MAVTTPQDTVTGDDVLALVAQLVEEHPPATTDPQEFLGAQFDLGLAWVHFPIGHGGLDADPKLQRTAGIALAAAGTPLASSRNPIGIGMAGPTLQAAATDEQLDRYLRPLFTGEEVWCQLFSEPGAGSDVAGLSTAAVLDGEEWVINGQKVWTSLGHVSRRGLLVARTNPDIPKHKGLTYFVIDMHQPGVDVRPLRQMTGQAEFNEVYFTDARVPDADRLGDVGDGWRVSLATLMNERAAIGGSLGRRGAGPIAHALRIWRDRGLDDAALRDQLVQLWCRSEVQRYTVARAEARRAVGVPGPEESIAKLAGSELNKDVYALCIDLLGPEGMLYGSYEMRRPETVEDYDLPTAFLRSRANTIEGGTSEIMRNILGERVLGLPGEPRVDRDVAWRDVPRS